METYKEAEAYINTIPKFTEKHSLSHTKTFLEALGCDETHLRARISHVAGTNGKGSICRYLAAILKAEGRHVGAFYSPHLVKMTERMEIDGRAIDEETFLDAFRRVKETAHHLSKCGYTHPTYFEFLFLMAMVIFQGAGVEEIVLETGLGGRLDCTNVFAKPGVTVIASISRDHEQYLGSTIAEIAGEKAGIIKEGVPVVALSDDAESFDVIKKRAEEKNSSLVGVSERQIKITEADANSVAFLLCNAYDNKEWRVLNGALCQAANVCEALAAAEILMNGHVHAELWEEAIRTVRNAGRMEEILPGVVVDGAHNIGACEAFARTLEKGGRSGKKVLLFSAVMDKDYTEMIRCLSKENFDACIVTEICDARGEKGHALLEAFRRAGMDAEEIDDFQAAFEKGLAEKGPDGTLYCLGSLYLVGMIKDAVGGK